MDLVDYEYYTTVYKGFITPSLKFPYYSERAFERIDARTIELSDEDKTTDEMKKCICSVTDILYKEENDQTLSSEKVGSYTRQYQDKKVKSESSKISNTMDVYLGDTGLLYRGF